MSDKKIKILVLGSAGMAGNVVTEHLESQDDFAVTNLAHARPCNERSMLLDLRNTQLFDHLLMY